MNGNQCAQNVPTVNRNENGNLSATQMYEALLMAVNMPKPELGTFVGNSLEYWGFINKFEAIIANTHRPLDNRTTLMYLIQSCTGKAKTSIENCIFLGDAEGYCKAKQILQDQFGQSFQVTTVHMTKVLNRQPIKPNDGAALWDLTRDMRKCEMVLSQMGFQADMNSSANLLQIQKLLPVHLQAEWAKRAQSANETRHLPQLHRDGGFH